MSWNYRIIKYGNGDFGLHEVHYDDKDRPVSMTVGPAGFVCHGDEDPKQIVAALEMAKAAGDEPILDSSIFACSGDDVVGS